jgi:hypothetical protein
MPCNAFPLLSAVNDNCYTANLRNEKSVSATEVKESAVSRP